MEHEYRHHAIARVTRSALIKEGAAVSPIVYDRARNVYTFEAEVGRAAWEAAEEAKMWESVEEFESRSRAMAVESYRATPVKNLKTWVRTPIPCDDYDRSS